METLANIPLAARRKLSFAYDSMNRRIQKTVWQGESDGSWGLSYRFDFLHELGGWNLLAERSNGTANTFVRTYAWGTDLSGNLQSAGGVGGLLFSRFHSSNKTLAHGYDLNGNVTLLVDMANSQMAAIYEYGAFGEPLRQSGESARLNPYRFSTKYTDEETGLCDYGYRYYNPEIGRWLNRDPIGEEGGVNLYGFCYNDPSNWFDDLGEQPKKDRNQIRNDARNANQNGRKTNIMGNRANRGAAKLDEAASAAGNVASAVGSIPEFIVSIGTPTNNHIENDDADGECVGLAEEAFKKDKNLCHVCCLIRGILMGGKVYKFQFASIKKGRCNGVRKSEYEKFENTNFIGDPEDVPTLGFKQYSR